jgi:4-amino-4-deoxy-L-arabinose transferase-like glycosyltransferase
MSPLIKSIQKNWEEKPLNLILILSSFILLIAVIFSKGFGMHDDHYSVIEAAMSWADGHDYNNWIHWNDSLPPPRHSLFYPGLHFILFTITKFMGINNPQINMLIARFLHALLALITLTYAYKITQKLSDQKTARLVALLFGTFWFFPFLNVRNLVEIACIPPLMIGFWFIVNAEERKQKNLQHLLAGLIMSIAFSVRFQTFLFIQGVGLALLLQKKWKQAICYGFGALLSIVLIQGGIDLFVFGKPFISFQGYTEYNMSNRYNFLAGDWHKYILLCLGLFIPPISLMISYGFVRSWKKHFLFFFPTLLFFVFHSYFPNKQERFIFPAIPFIIILGIIGWNSFIKTSSFWKKRPKTLRYSWVFFWFLNLIALPVATVHYSKKTRVESMYYLYQNNYKGSFLVENSNHNSSISLPRAYSKNWKGACLNLTKQDLISQNISLTKEQKILSQRDLGYIIFFEEKNIQARVNRLKKLFPKLHHKKTIEPSFLDWLTHKLNPKYNKNYVTYIYKVKD